MRTIALDLETTDLTGKVILGFGMADTQGKSRAYQWNPQTKGMLTEMVSSGQVRWVFHNAKFDVRVLRQHGIIIQPGQYDDTQIMSWVLDPSQMTYGLDACCRRYGLPGKLEAPDWSDNPTWNDDMAEYCRQDVESTILLYEHVMGELKKDERAWYVYEAIERPYIEAIMEFESTGFLLDVELLESLTRHLSKKKDGLGRVLSSLVPPLPEFLDWNGKEYSPNLDKCYREYQTRMTPLSGDMTLTQHTLSIPIEEPIPAKWELVRTNKKSKAIVGMQWSYLPGTESDVQIGSTTRDGITYGSHCRLQDFNPNSGQQLAYVLQQRWSWQPRKTTKTGLPKTDEEELEKLQEQAEDKELAHFIRMYLDYTSTAKLLDSFLVKFAGMMDSHHILRGSFNQTGTMTGRLSSSEPNLTNVPAKFGTIRKLFTSPPGWCLVGIDLSNIESRVLAHYLKVIMDDDSMCKVFEQGLDFHQANADAWKVTRSEAKTLLYASLYGAGKEKVGKGDIQRGAELMQRLEQNAPSLMKLKELVWRACEAKGGVIHDVFGRRLVYRDIIWENALSRAKEAVQSDVDGKLFTHNPHKLAKSWQAQAQRQVFNAVLQGSAASILKVLASIVMEAREKMGLQFRLAAAVHDELQMYAPIDKANELCAILEEIFKTDLLKCPIEGTAKQARNWYGTH